MQEPLFYNQTFVLPSCYGTVNEYYRHYTVSMVCRFYLTSLKQNETIYSGHDLHTGRYRLNRQLVFRS